MIKFHKPDIGPCENFAVSQVLRSGWLTTGAVTKEFEEKFARYVGAGYAVFVSSCTAALKLSIQWYKQKYKWKDGIEGVAVPSLTYAATVNEIVLNQMIPVFKDVNEQTLMMDDDDYKGLFSGNIVMQIKVAYGGQPPKIKWDTGPIIVDSAHYIERDCMQGQPGTWCFSFYPTKNMTTGEGGMIVTNDPEEYEWYMKARHHGKNKPVGSGYDLEFIGSKYNNNDIAAAIGIEQLIKLDSFNAKRNKIRDHYNASFGKHWAGNHLYVIRVPNRSKFIADMVDAGIETSIHFKPVHQMSAYREYKNYNLPVTNKVAEEIVSLPLYPSLTDWEVNHIIKKVKPYVR